MVLEWAGRGLPSELRDRVSQRLRGSSDTETRFSMLQSSFIYPQIMAMGGLWKEEGFLAQEYRKEGALDKGTS